MQSIGCVAARMCNTNACPAGIATQDPALRARLDADAGAERLTRFFRSSTELIELMARACGHADIGQFSPDDLSTWSREMADLCGVRFAGVGSAD